MLTKNECTTHWGPPKAPWEVWAPWVHRGPTCLPSREANPRGLYTLPIHKDVLSLSTAQTHNETFIRDDMAKSFSTILSVLFASVCSQRDCLQLLGGEDRALPMAGVS